MRMKPLALKAGLLGVLLGLVTGGLAVAQSPLSQPSNPTPGESPAQQIVTSPSGPSSPSWFDTMFSQKLPIDFGFHLGGAYSDNIYYQPKKTYDYIVEMQPSLDLTLGKPIRLDRALDMETIDDLTDAGNLNYLHLNYSPLLRLYDINSKLDDIDEHADGIYTHIFGKLTFSLEQSYEKLSQPTIQINAQGILINRDIFTTTAKANYVYSDELSTYGTATQTVNNYASNLYTNNTEWTADYYFLYQLLPKIAVGFGPRIGFEDIAQAPNQTFQAGLIHLDYAYSGKVELVAAGGAEIREFEHDTSATEVTPIVEGSLIYQPFDSMTLKLDGERHRIVAAGQIGDDYTASVVSLDFRQRFFQKIYFTANGGYETDQYTLSSFNSVGGTARDDNIYFCRAGLEWASFRGITVAAGYEYLRDDSNFHINTFTENRYTLSATVKY